MFVVMLIHNGVHEKGTNVVFGTADGGWAFAEKWVSDASSGEEKVVPLYSAQEANAIVTNAANRLILRQAPVFSATATMLSPDPDPEKQRDERYEILAYRIPALSPAMGITDTHSSKISPFSFRFAAGPPRGGLGAFRFLLENSRPNLTTCHRIAEDSFFCVA